MAMKWTPLVGTAALLLGTMVGLKIAAEELPMLSEDAIAYPPAYQAIMSPGEIHILVLRSQEGARQQSVATLYRVAESLCEPQWSQTLPQEYGPRFGVVTDQGYAVLLDEWINVASDYAVTVIDPTGQVIAQPSFDAVADALRQPRADIVEKARYGWWITSAPVISRDGQTVQVNAAGRRLRIRARDGRLSI